MHEHDCPWDKRTCEQAGWSGHVEVLRWALDHGCPSGGWGISDGRMTLKGVVLPPGSFL